MNKLLLLTACALLSSGAFADCTTGPTGRTVCSGENRAGGVNPNTGRAWSAQQNAAGVTTTQTSRGGEAKTKNGKGVYRSPSGKKCVKTANNQGCQ